MLKFDTADPVCPEVGQEFS